jgi:hypothetical protein
VGVPTHSAPANDGKSREVGLGVIVGIDRFTLDVDVASEASRTTRSFRPDCSLDLFR